MTKKERILIEAKELGIEVDPSLHEYVIESIIAQELAKRGKQDAKWEENISPLNGGISLIAKAVLLKSTSSR